MTANKDRGFTVVEVLLTVIALSLVVLVGAYVYHQANPLTRPPSKVTEATQGHKSVQKPAADVTANWTPYTTVGNDFSFRYPSGWTKNVCDANFVLLGPDAGSAGHCQSDATAQILLSSVRGDRRLPSKLDPTNFPDLISQSVTVDGVTGTKESGTLKSAEQQFVGPQNGSKEVNFIFYKNDTTYVMTYVQTPDFTDVLYDFNLIVTRTLKF